MGKTYGVPRSAKGESRFLYVFTIKSTFTTLGGGAVGFLFYLLFSMFGLKTVGFVFIIVCALLGFGIGTFSIPDSPIVGNLRKAGGEKISEILLRTLTFTKRKKIYVYREVGKK
ncbi:MAG: hypothetical protein Q4D02_07850 [Clostridia bacterium]|nr:hypothetical protein [Clostridia bacterium]